MGRIGAAGRGAALVALALGAFFGPAAATADRELGDPSSLSKRFVPGEVIVAFDRGVDPAERAEARQAVDGEVAERLPLPAVQVLELDRGGVWAAVRELEGEPGVRYAEPNLIVSTSATPDDDFYPDLWGLHNTGQSVPDTGGTAGTPDADIDAPEAWDVETGDSGVTVAVVDSGVSYEHPDLAGNIWANPGETGAGKATNGIDDDANGLVDDHLGWDFVGTSPFDPDDADNEPRDLNGHGTHVAGTIGAVGNDALGIPGVNWDVSLMPVRAMNANGTGALSDVAAAFDYAVEEGADIVNASVGVAGSSSLLAQAVGQPDAADVLFVVAAGNDGSDNDTTPVTPCNIAEPNLVCVAASDQDDVLADFSNFGETAVDLAAPGTTIASDYPRAPGSVAFAEDFEADFTGWTTGVVGGTVDDWARTDELPSFGADWSLADSPGADYAQGVDSFARPDPINLTGRSECTVSYRALLDMDADPWAIPFEPGEGDLTDVEARVGSEWVSLALLDGAAEVSRTEDISMLDGLSNAQIRFTIFADGDGTVDGGVHYDDVVVSCYGNGIAYLGGTSMASPHVAGVAALALAHQPTASVADLRGALLEGVDFKCSLEGRVATGGRLNARTTLDLIGGAPGTPPPAPCSSPPQPTPPAPSTPPPARDLDPPSITLSGKKTQKLGKAVKVRVGCDETCSVSAQGKLRAGSQGSMLKPRTDSVARGETARLKLVLGARALGLARQALQRDRKVSVRTTVSATDVAGNGDLERFTIKLKG
ncbi:MAG TPA: S8 family peptidase [Solirubrobacterales bacterium]|nr:S8 family peptidase [Solirubrobacterales bacterium]